MPAPAEPIAAPGFYSLTAAQYHADPCAQPSLSSTIARVILAKSLAHAHAEHPRLGAASTREETAAMDTGSIVHALLAGTVENEIEVRDFPTFRSKAAQEWAKAARDSGKIPALEADLDSAQKIAAAVRAKAAVGITEDPFTHGAPEVSAVWIRDGAYFRARFDRLVHPVVHPCTIWDWKVTGDVSVAEVKRKFRRFGYHLQAAHYLAALDALVPEFAGRHSFVFVFVEDAPPYSVRRYCLKSDTAIVAQIDIAKAHGLWIGAMKSGVWPDATRLETTLIDIPNFADDDDEPDAIAV